MSAEQLFDAVVELGCTPAELAECLDVDVPTIGRWLRGAQPIPGPAALAVGFILTTCRDQSGQSPAMN
jgi:hypothetical protein